MYEYGAQYPLDFRQEIVKPLFERIQATESCILVGAASMGKTRLLDFITRSDVQEHYLTAEAQNTVLLRVDCNRIAQASEWGFYELMLTTIVESANEHPKTRDYYKSFNDLREPVILKENILLALRHLELATHILTKNLGLRVCFLLDEFDDIYHSLPAMGLANLRALRDMNKNQLCYVLFMRHAPKTPQDRSDCESFKELLRFIYGLKPYTRSDAIQIIHNLEERRQHRLPGNLKEAIVQISGGHPGLILALFDASLDSPQWFEKNASLSTLATQPSISDECYKIWRSLPDDEQKGLVCFVGGQTLPDQVHQRLSLKGLLHSNRASKQLFSPLFSHYIAKAGSEGA